MTRLIGLRLNAKRDRCQEDEARILVVSDEVGDLGLNMNGVAVGTKMGISEGVDCENEP